MKPRPSGPSATEIKLRSEVDRMRREITRLKKGAAEGAAAAAAAESAATPELNPAAPDSVDDAAALRLRVEQLETIRDRLSKLYVAQLDENRRRSTELYEVLKAVGHINADLDLESLLRRVVTAIQATLGFRAVVIRLRDPGTHRLKAAAFAGLSPVAEATLEAEDVQVQDFESWLREEFRVSQSFFISHKHPFNAMLPRGVALDLGTREEWEWHHQDVLLVPLRGPQGDLVGYLSMDDPVDRLVPSRASIELLELLAAHARVAIDNARLYRDLQERTRDLEAATQRSNEINVLKSNFVSTVSHELLTPLTTIRAFLDALRAGGPEVERLPRFIDVINEETQRLSRLIVSILDLSRFDSGTQAHLRQTVDLSELLGESAQVLKPMADAGQVNLKVANELADTLLDADRDQLRQLLLHLGSNAIKFTPPGGSVMLHVTGDERQVRLRVEDTGIGIPGEALDKVFDRFYQVDSSLVRRYGGVGLGLALCKSIVEWHGGRIEATSVPDQGSCFTVELPRRGTARVVSREGGSGGTDLVKLAVEMVAEVMNAGVVSMMTVQPGDELAIQAAIGLDPRVVRNARVALGDGVSGWVAQQRRPVCVTRPEDAADVRASGRSTYSTGTFLSVPLESSEGRLIGVLNVTEPTSGRPFEPDDCRLALDLADRVARAWERSRSLEKDRIGIEDAAEALRQVIEHLRRGQRSAPQRVRLAAAIARELRLDEEQLGIVAFAAAVHDVGMTLVGDNILGGREFNDEDRVAMQRHVELGADLLHRIETVGAVREVVLSHHEWWDGTGYPQGLREADIPIGARVLAVVDAFESMTQGRAHRAARSHEAARDEIARLKGRQFDPEVVEAFERVLPSFEVRHSAAVHEGRSATFDAGR